MIEVEIWELELSGNFKGDDDHRHGQNGRMRRQLMNGDRGTYLWDTSSFLNLDVELSSDYSQISEICCILFAK